MPRIPALPAPPAAPPRAWLKGAAERLALAGGVAAASRARLRGGTLILAYHGVVPEGETPAGERSLHVAQRRLAAHLDVLRRTHDVVPLAEVLAPARDGRPRVAITFDDAYRGAVTAGVAELVKRGLPATFFAVPGRVGGDGFWWDALVPPGADALPAAFRAEALDRARGQDAAVRALVRTRGLREHPLPPHARPASLAELHAAARVPGITIASHTWSHPSLTRLSADEVADEIRRPLAWLREHFPSACIPWLSYPYGAWTAEVARAAEAAGYAGAVRVEGGWVPRTIDPWALPRVNVPAGLSPRGLALRAAGLLCR